MKFISGRFPVDHPSHGDLVDFRINATTRSESPSHGQPPRGAARGGPELEILYGEDALDRLPPMVRRKIKKAPVTACVATGVWNGVLVEASRVKTAMNSGHVYAVLSLRPATLDLLHLPRWITQP